MNWFNRYVLNTSYCLHINCILCVCVHVCVCLCMCACVCLWLYNKHLFLSFNIHYNMIVCMFNHYVSLCTYLWVCLAMLHVFIVIIRSDIYTCVYESVFNNFLPTCRSCVHLNMYAQKTPQLGTWGQLYRSIQRTCTNRLQFCFSFTPKGGEKDYRKRMFSSLTPFLSFSLLLPPSLQYFTAPAATLPGH